MDKEINELIRKNLPQQVGEQLQQELKELYAIRDRHQAMEAEFKETANSLKLTKGALIDAQGKIREQDEFDTERLQFAIDRAVLNKQMEMAESINRNYLGVVTAVFGNSKMKYGLTGTVPVPVDGGGDYSGHVLNEVFNVSVEKE